MPIATESKHIPCCLVSKRIGYIRFTPHHTRLGRVCTQRQRHPWQTVESTQSVMRVTNRKSGGTSCLEKTNLARLESSKPYNNSQAATIQVSGTPSQPQDPNEHQPRTCFLTVIPTRAAPTNPGITMPFYELRETSFQSRHVYLFIITSTPLGVMPIDEDTHFSYARFAVATPTAMSNSFP